MYLVEVTMRRWLPCPYMIGTLNNLLFSNRWASCLETWYVASGESSKSYRMMTFSCLVDLDLSFARTKLNP